MAVSNHVDLSVPMNLRFDIPVIGNMAAILIQRCKNKHLPVFLDTYWTITIILVLVLMILELIILHSTRYADTSMSLITGVIGCYRVQGVWVGWSWLIAWVAA